ncbi:gamma-glutamyltransferase [Mesorhizobium koreense]|uniref:gamma-glutamyltransferase n=1 Tax=Mesorhizobium koreense TaxID=3074855 RepID=UPI00287B801D|nr:gamma-glutamyltransferase [Mesorhizobium sp. WR6]
MNNFSRSQTVRKPATVSRGGIVAAQHRRAAEAGAAVLEAGGDAIDAAVAVSFAIGVVEPWMSGPTGGGAMMVWRADEAKATAVYYGMRSPAGLDPADYPLSGDGHASDLFPWRAVVDDRNVRGATAVAVPGVVDGIGVAHERWGKMPWRDLLQPAVSLAREGLHVDWYAALIIASVSRELARDPDAARVFLEDSQWPTIAGWTALSDKRIDFGPMADTLARLAEKGHRELYEGEIGEALAKDIQGKGGSLSFEDLKVYRAAFQKPLVAESRRGRLHVTPELTAGPTIADVFARLAEAPDRRGTSEGDNMLAVAEAFEAAYAKRLSAMGDNESPNAPACTTHFSIVDRHGNMVAMTQTLLSIFGSRIISPSTGLLLNNGIMWFDPEPGNPNSLAPNKRCLMNVCPVIGEGESKRFAIGASGGRKIMPAVTQLSLSMLEDGMDIDAAFHRPRIDFSGGTTVVADETLPAEVMAALKARYPVQPAKRTVFPYAFACPAGVMREGEINSGATEIMSPWGDAVHEKEGT